MVCEVASGCLEKSFEEDQCTVTVSFSTRRGNMKSDDTGFVGGRNIVRLRNVKRRWCLRVSVLVLSLSRLHDVQDANICVGKAGLKFRYGSVTV